MSRSHPDLPGEERAHRNIARTYEIGMQPVSTLLVLTYKEQPVEWVVLLVLTHYLNLKNALQRLQNLYAASPLHPERKAGTIRYDLLVLLQAIGSHYCLFTYVERPMSY